MKRIVIIGATSGLGQEVAKELVKQGWRVGVAGRRISALEEFQLLNPSLIEIQQLDVTVGNAPAKLQELIDKLGGMDVFLQSSGTGSQNMNLNPEIEINTAKTNVEGFIRMATAAFLHFKQRGGGHLAVISSIAGTKGMGAAAAYSATKRFQNTYIDALDQLSHMEHLNIRFTDIRPGFAATALLKDGNYPLLMQTGYVAKRIVKALKHQKRVAVIDWKYAILVFFWRMIPRRIWNLMPVKNGK